TRSPPPRGRDPLRPRGALPHPPPRRRPPRECPPPPPAPPADVVPQAPEATACSFCGRSKAEVGRLIGGTTDPHAAICDSCIKLYADLIGQTLPSGRYN